MQGENMQPSHGPSCPHRAVRGLAQLPLFRLLVYCELEQLGVWDTERSEAGRRWVRYSRGEQRTKPTGDTAPVLVLSGLWPPTQRKRQWRRHSGVRAVGQERVTVEEEERQSRVCSKNKSSARSGDCHLLPQKPGGEMVKWRCVTGRTGLLAERNRKQPSKGCGEPLQLAILLCGTHSGEDEKGDEASILPGHLPGWHTGKLGYAQTDHGRKGG